MKRIFQQIGTSGFLFFANGLFWLAAGALLLAEGCRRGMAGCDAAERRGEATP